MADYIERGALLDGQFPEENNEYQRGWNDALKGAFYAVPAADVVEVCRCRDCKWTDNVLFKNKVIWCDHDEQWVEEDNFCKYGSRGERKSE